MSDLKEDVYAALPRTRSKAGLENLSWDELDGLLRRVHRRLELFEELLMREEVQITAPGWVIGSLLDETDVSDL